MTTPKMQVYRYVLDFIASQPTHEQIAAFRPTDDMKSRLESLIKKEQNNTISQEEQQEISEHEQVEHLIVLLKKNVFYTN